jgi:hypothetical protein
MSAIPTRYNGVQFRSRLEARWAAFFDLVGWRWEYEPLDLDGYIPDFVLCDHILVEVKPVLWWAEDMIHGTAETALARAITAAGDSWTWIAVLGAKIIPDPDDDTSYRLGRVRELISKIKYTSLTAIWWRDTQKVSLNAQYILSGKQIQDKPNLAMFWREAGNRVQWRAPGATAR